jgi:competence protein ComEA
LNWLDGKDGNNGTFPQENAYRLTVFPPYRPPMPPAEARAILLLMALALVGQGVRYFLTGPGNPPGQVQLLGSAAPGSPAAQRDSAMLRARPLAPDERIDPDVASAADLARLPKVGFRLARVIVADREAHGPFSSLAGLDRVAGIGPGLLKTIGPHLIFTGTANLPISALSPSEITAPLSAIPAAPLNLNSAGSSELEALPGVGSAKAAAILQYREQHGPFTSVDQLDGVPGFGPAAVSRLRSRLTVK